MARSEVPAITGAQRAELLLERLQAALSQRTAAEIDGLETLVLQLACRPDLTASALKILDRGDEVMTLLDAMAAWNAQLGLVQGKETAMMLVADAANGVARYGHLFSRAAGTRAGTVVFQAADATSAKGMAATYAKFNDALLSEPGGDFLFGFTAADLCDRQARIVIAEVVSPTGHTQLVGAVHVACDDTGTPWIRGLGVSSAFRRQNLARALVAVAMADRLRRMGSAETWRAAVIIKEGEPNRNSVRALAPLGFALTGEGGMTPLKQDARDRHLIANAVATPDGPGIRYAKLRLPCRQAGLAQSFWAGWGI